MSDLTSEKIAKALKGAGLSSKQRIEKATEAWTNDAIFFPNKDAFLLDWICSAFAKPNMKKLDDCCLIQLPYWTLLADLLNHYQQKTIIDPKRSAPTIHVNLVSSVSALLQLMFKEDTKLSGNKIDYLALCHQCLEVLFSDSFALSYRPAFEHVTTAVDQILSSLIQQINKCIQNADNEEELECLHTLSLGAHVLLKKFDNQLVLAANQKKIFSSIVEKSLVRLLSVRRKINIVGQDTCGISKIITDIICHALFHADTVLEFTSVLKEANSDNSVSGNVKQVSYVVKLFETLETMAAGDNEEMLDALDITPTLLSSFLDSFRQKRNTSTNALQDIGRMAEFGIFVFLFKIISNVKERSVSAYLETLCRLLKEFLQWNVYSARNDDIAKSQQNVLSSIADEMITFLDDPKKYDQGLALDLADTLLQIDLSFIESRVHSLWPVMLNSEDAAQESCLKFSKSILSTYSASRQIDVFIKDLIQYIGKIECNNVYDVLKKPMFSRNFLSEFSSLVTKSMPAAQALGIFKSFEKTLIALCQAQPIDGHVSKKQKKSVESNGPGNTTVALTTIYFVEFSNALKLNQQQIRSFEESVTSVFENFVKPSIAKWNKSKSDSEITVLPAMQIHFALITTFFDIYFCKITTKDQEWLSQAYLEIFQSNLAMTTLTSRIAVVTSATTILQHVYYTSLNQISSTAQTTDLVNLVADFVTDVDKKTSWYETAHWSGFMLDLETKDIVKLACWKLLSDEWFESVVRFIDNNRAGKIANIIYLSLTNDTPSSKSVSAKLLNTTLLRSANFYEAKCFKDCNIQAILNAFVQLFKTKLFTASASGLSKATAAMISALDVTKAISVDKESIKSLTNILALNTNNDMDIDADGTANMKIEKLVILLKLLLLFPSEYYEKHERPQVLYLATLLDIWCTACTNDDVLSRTKVSLMCRSLQLRFIGYFSAHSVLGLDPNVLDFLVSSNSRCCEGRNKQISNSLDHITNELDLQILRKIVASTGNKVPDDHSVRYFEGVMEKRINNLENNHSNIALSKLINLVRAINLVLANRKSEDVDLNDAIYYVNSMSTISKFIISALESSKVTITKLLKEYEDGPIDKYDHITEYNSKFENIKHIFHLTRLIQDYARIVGSAVDKEIAAETLSQTLTGLTSPFIQFLQSALQSNNTENNVVLNMTTEFIAAFCSILSRYQQVETTKRVLATIWFVYSLVLGTGDQHSTDILSTAFAAWIKSLSKDQYTIVLGGFFEQSEEEANTRLDASKERHHLVFLSLFSLLLKHCNNSEKGRLRKHIPAFVLKLSLIAGKTTSIEYLQKMVKLLEQLTGDQSYNFKDYDASLVLSCLLQVAHPTAVERFKGQMNREIAHSLFDDVCSALSNFISHHKEQVVYMMPPFIAFIQSLLHCFKSTHVSLINGTNSPSKKRKHNAEQKAKDTINLKYTGRTIPLLFEFAPLDDSSAQRLARVLTTIPLKQHFTSSSKTAKSTQTLYKIIAKHTPSILIEYFTIQADLTMSIVQPSTKSILTQALYDILDMCSDSDRTFILSSLDGSGKALFKSFYTKWKDNHKYTGQ